MLKFAQVVSGRLLRRFEDYVCNDDSAGDGILLGLDKRHVDGGMPVNDGLHFFWIDLQATNVDHSVASANKVVPAISQFEKVAGIHEAVRIAKDGGVAAEISACSSIGPDRKGTIYDLHFYVRRMGDYAGRESGEPVVHIKCDTGFRSGERVSDSSLRVNET